MTDWVYLAAAACFILGLKRLSSPVTARSGNGLGAAGMLLAVAATLLKPDVIRLPVLLAGLGIGTVIGAVAARRVAMTAMPQMVALLNGFGGGASLLVAWVEALRAPAVSSPVWTAVVMASVGVGGITFSGSGVAFAKLQGWLPGRPLTFFGQKEINLILALGGLGAAAMLTIRSPQGAPGTPFLSVEAALLFYGALAAAFLLGLLGVLPVGGADMPVVIAFLNAGSGLAAAFTGFVLDNRVLVIAGALVGASGLLLTRLMCAAMNRSLANVFFGSLGGRGEPGGVAVEEESPRRSVREASPEDAAVLLHFAGRVIIVPGYGLAVAQAQHVLKELTDLLETRGVEVKFAIHPVAGRMPGHMNVLLAEADVPYEKLFDLERINAEFENTDVALVVGANDVTNPAARTERQSPLYGMPVLDVDRAKTVIVVKRSLKPGFAGVDNPLFYRDHTRMLFGDAKAAVREVIAALKGLR